ncbi:MAG: trans-sulfuration enzyme family protein [Bacteroidia bacterium]
MKKNKDISFIINHLGEERSEYYGAVSPPLFQSVNYCSPTVAAFREKLKAELDEPFYTRGYNPTVAMLRKKIAALEGAEDALIFGSGSAAVAAAIMSMAKQGDHVLCIDKPYSWTGVLLTKYLSCYGVETTYVKGPNIPGFEKAIKPNTRLIYLESPNSLTFELQDIESISAFAKQKGIAVVVDNSYNSPLNQSPLELGADLVIHSATKYLNGHSDAVAGVVCGSKARIVNMFKEEYMALGGIISPHDAWLILRGLRTLELRVNKSAENALFIARKLERNPLVEKIYYPFLDSHPQHELATKQMEQGGGLFSVCLRVEKEEMVERFCDSLQRFLIATSWGGYESLVFPLCALAKSTSFKDPLPWNMLRFYIGIENKELLLSDLEQALGQMH